ncbi:MAG: hypothetical protein JW829_12725 [Pirellulales bacterium]|nr:hypothetical protein [Pirellulales bacterium]
MVLFLVASLILLRRWIRAALEMVLKNPHLKPVLG